MWVWVTAFGLVVELGIIVVLGRAATRGTEQDLPPRPPRRAVTVPEPRRGPAVTRGAHRAAP
jgi:hypothetical protein